MARGGRAPALIAPRPVVPGDVIGIAAPAGPVDRRAVEEGEQMLQALGFRTRRAPGLFARRGYLAGTDAQRARGFMSLVDDARVAGILCARGGYGCHRIIDRLDAARVRRAAKPLIGYSDITTLLLWQRRRAGLVGWHGPMLERGGSQPRPVQGALVSALAGEASPLRGRLLLRGRPGAPPVGRLTGGNLTLLAASLGTPWEVEARGSILLFEEVGEKPYAMDRSLEQLRAAGKLDRLVAVGVGALTGCEDAAYPTPTALDVIRERLRPLGIPVVEGLPFGHSGPNRPWPLGGRARVDVSAAQVELVDSGPGHGERRMR